MSINRIQTFNPTLLDPSGVKQGQFATAISGPCGTLYFYNESLETLELTTPGGELIGILPGMWAQPFVVNNPPAYVNWLSTATQQATTDFTLQEVQGLAYTSNEDTSKLYTGPLIRQTNLGGTVNTNVSGSTLDNEGNPVGTIVITIRPSDVAAGSYTIKADNQGNVQIQSDNAGALVNLINLIAGASPEVILAATNILTLIQGNARVLGSLAVGSTLNTAFQALIGAQAADQVALGVFAAAAPTANVVQIEDSSFTDRVVIDHNFHFGIGPTGGNPGAHEMAEIDADADTTSCLVLVAHSATQSSNLFLVDGPGPSFTEYFIIGPTGELVSNTKASLDNGAILTDGSGNVILNTLSVGAGAAYLDAPSGGSLFRVGSGGSANAGNLMDFTSVGDVYIKTGALSGRAFHFQSPNGTSQWSRQKEALMSGSGGGSFGTGIGTPTGISPDPTTVSGSSQTIGCSIAATSTVTVGAGLAWQALAYHF